MGEAVFQLVIFLLCSFCLERVISFSSNQLMTHKEKTFTHCIVCQLFMFLGQSFPCSFGLQIQMSLKICYSLFSIGCGPFVQSFNRSDLPDGFKMTEEHDSVSSPRSIDVASKLTYYSGSKTFYPGISVNWTTPTASKFIIYLRIPVPVNVKQ